MTSVERDTAIDAALLLAIPSFLAVLHFFVPSDVQNQLVFYYGDPDPVTAWTSALLHGSDTHLYSNMVGYGVAIIPAYVIYSQWGRRREFWASIFVLIVAVPFVTSAVDYWIFQIQFEVGEDISSRGFSGIASAFGGMLLASIGLFLVDEYDRQTAFSAINLIVLVAMAFLAWNIGGLTPVIAGLVVLGLALILSRLVSLSWIREPSSFVDALRENQRGVVLALYGGFAVCVIVVAIFPVDVVEAGVLTNIFAHGVGFAVGIVGALAVYLFATRGTDETPIVSAD
ncbi:hypothetical protein OB919_15730 [Halobacteria archaeon AArc-curdl1]|uniref:Uncharacterized protein n=1 Tax=Natronosalvus hydrolyticus TaxID=2979988 RepID=A0AAP3E8M8_9EURY|nr:hypothetical protein [Halobacteria archaeon AArc-curdl1]